MNFALCTLDQAVNTVIVRSRSQTAEAGSIRLSNAWCIVLADRYPSYKAALNSPGITFPDGAPVALVLKKLHRDSEAAQIRGASLFRGTLCAGAPRRIRHFFLGGSEETLTKLQERLQQEVPDLCVAGAWSPPFGPVSKSTMDTAANLIGQTNPDIVWVSLGTPKQDYVSAELSKRTGKLTIAVGAAFDFVAGTARESPVFIQRIGLEWAYRLVSEPRRLWRRYLIGNAQYIRIAIRELRRGRQ